MAAPISSSSPLNNKKILAEAFKEYINGNEFRPFMGDNPSAIIQLKTDTSKGRGDIVWFSLLQAFDPDEAVTGNAQVTGQEEDLVYREDSVTVDYIRHAAKVEQHKLSDVRTPLPLLTALRPQLMDQATQRLRNDIIDAAAITATPHRTRVLFGAADSNFNATLATALANIDASADKLSVDMIKIAKRKARNVKEYSNQLLSRKIRPFKAVQANKAITEMYALFASPIAADHLQDDPAFKDLRDDNRQNMISMPYFDGSKYIGMVDGVMVYEIDDLSRLTRATAGDGGTPVVQNLLCGAQAFGVAVADPGSFQEEKFDYDFHRGLCYTIIRGTKMLKFAIEGGALVESGVVHVFSHGAV